MVIKVTRALISTYDKTGLLDLATFLHQAGVELYASGGTAAFLQKAGIPAHNVEELTGFPEILAGRVKTLHPRIFGGILAKPSDREVLEEHKIPFFQLVVVNFYPFQKVVAQDCTLEEALENIDIGGPAMVRAAAKNHQYTCVVTHPSQYHEVIQDIKSHGGVSPSFSQKQALQAFIQTASYDAWIVNYLERQYNGDALPDIYLPLLQKMMVLRYGENPQQKAACYQINNHQGGIAHLQQLQGKQLSFNNLLDIDAAWRCVSAFQAPAAVIVKHTNPCGIAQGDTLLEAFESAWACDPQSAFGGIIVLSDPCDEALAEKIVKNFVEVVGAPDFTEGARKIFMKKKNLRLLRLPGAWQGDGYDMKRLAGAVLLQEWDADDDPSQWEVVTQRQPTQEEWKKLAFAWKAVRFVKSNAVVFAQTHHTVGIGAGQMSRVDAVRLAITKANQPLAGCAVGSDAFFPFRDSIDLLAQAGATAVIQPGGSIRDGEVIDACNELGITMVFTHRRHFKH